MNVLHIGKSDIHGGVARASYRIHQAINKNKRLNINSKMRVIIKKSKEENIYSKENIFHSYLFPKYITLVNKLYRFGFKTKNNVIHSTAIINTGLAREINFKRFWNDIDIIHLHWLGDVTMSIKEIGFLNKPVVWTLHDQWPYCGAEHCVYPNANFIPKLEDQRYLSSYSKESRLNFESGRDINRLTWLRKKKAWGKKMYIVCPSRWMSNCAKRSSLLEIYFTVPNPIDTETWLPISKTVARRKLNHLLINI